MVKQSQQMPMSPAGQLQKPERYGEMFQLRDNLQGPAGPTITISISTYSVRK